MDSGVLFLGQSVANATFGMCAGLFRVSWTLRSRSDRQVVILRMVLEVSSGLLPVLIAEIFEHG